MLKSFDRAKPPRIYVHIPFCRRKCAYCSFCSVPVGTGCASLPERYFDRLKNEARFVRSFFTGVFPSIYIGGGTPNLPEVIDGALAILDILGPADEITIEGNPSFLSERTLGMIIGRVNRLSIGVQSFSERARRAVGRFDEMDGLYPFLVKARSAAPELRVNLDFLTNFESKETFIARFRSFVRFCANSRMDLPEHISLYSLQLDEGTAYTDMVRKGRRKEVEEEIQARRLAREWDYLEGLGYEHYEVSAFSRDGCYCRHNLGYWSGESFLGLGCQAASRAFLPDGTGVEIKCESGVETYASGNAFSGYEIGRLSVMQVALERLLTGLRTKWGVEMAALGRAVNVRDLEDFCRGLAGVEVADGRIRLKKSALLLCESRIRQIACFIQEHSGIGA